MNAPATLDAAVGPISGVRWDVILHLLGDDTGSVLDIGCRDRALEAHLPDECDYVGVDLGPPADVVASADEPLPFESDSFDAVVLADVLEHLERPHEALDEATRVARRSVVVLLPNLYSLWFRVRFALGKTAGKYEFGPVASRDRHRWLMNFSQAREFTHGRAASVGWHVATEYGFDGGFRRPTAKLAYRTARALRGPDLWAWEYVARLEPGGR